VIAVAHVELLIEAEAGEGLLEQRVGVSQAVFGDQRFSGYAEVLVPAASLGPTAPHAATSAAIETKPPTFAVARPRDTTRVFIGIVSSRRGHSGKSQINARRCESAGTDVRFISTSHPGAAIGKASETKPDPRAALSYSSSLLGHQSRHLRL